MAGHNKWSKIKRKKEASDLKKGREFGKLARAIERAAQHGIDPEGNITLRVAVEQARAANMPRTNIERAINKGAGGGDAVVLKQTRYEAYGPGGAAILIEAHTNNTNRTVAEIKHILQEHGGMLVGAGGVTWMFHEGSAVAPITLTKPELSAFQKLYREVSEHEDVERVLTNVENL